MILILQISVMLPGFLGECALKKVAIDRHLIKIRNTIFNAMVNKMKIGMHIIVGKRPNQGIQLSVQQVRRG